MSQSRDSSPLRNWDLITRLANALSLQYFLLHQKGSNVTTLDNNWQLQDQDSVQEGVFFFFRKSQGPEREKIKPRKLKLLAPTATANIRTSFSLRAALPQFLLPDLPCLALNKKFWDLPKDKKKKCVCRDKASITSRHSYDTMLESCNGELKIMMNNMLRALMEGVDNILGQMGNIRRERETLRKNKKKCWK